MKTTLFVLMLAAAAFVGCQKQEAAAPVVPVQEPAVMTSTTTAVPATPATPATPETTPAGK